MRSPCLTMVLTVVGKFVVSIFPLILLASSLAADDSSTRRFVVDVRKGGDDGLTSRLAAALEDGFRRSPDFVLADRADENMLIVTIPTNVDWTRTGNRSKVSSKIEFSSSRTNLILGTSSVACWDDELSKCASRVVKDARHAARQIGTTVKSR